MGDITPGLDNLHRCVAKPYHALPILKFLSSYTYSKGLRELVFQNATKFRIEISKQ